MITLFTGMPGAGKTAALVDLLSRLPGDRPIFVHYDPAAKRRPDQIVLHESLLIPHQPIHANEWPGALPDDAILIIDEVQDVWRPRGSTTKVPDAIAALETHRHSGIDIYLTTQAPRLVDANVRGLIGRHVHIRDTGWLGRHWYEWPECNDSMVWKSCPVKKSYKLPAKVFDLYKSAVTHNKPIRSTPAALYWAIALIVLAVGLAIASYRVFSRDRAPVASAAPAPVGSSVGSALPAPRLSSSSGPIDDRVDFIPRVSGKPESAPAYDHLRVIVAMPVVRGGMCVGEKCKCITDQGTDAGLSNADCRAYVSSPPFDPYRAPAAPATTLAGGASAGTPRPASRSPAVPSLAETVSPSVASL